MSFGGSFEFFLWGFRRSLGEELLIVLCDKPPGISFGNLIGT
jgi:hypothetical protein